MYLSPARAVNGALADISEDSPHPAAVLAGLPSGKAGTIATLKHMEKFVQDSLRNPRQIVRNLALRIFQESGVPPRAWNREMSALHAFVKDKIRYVRDPVGLEMVAAPERTLEIGQGDCDDKATLLAALLMASGHPARFTVVGFKGQPFSHVMVEALSGRKRWVPMETIIDRPVGWFPSGVTSKYSLNVRKR